MRHHEILEINQNTRPPRSFPTEYAHVIERVEQSGESRDESRSYGRPCNANCDPPDRLPGAILSDLDLLDIGCWDSRGVAIQGQAADRVVDLLGIA